MLHGHSHSLLGVTVMAAAVTPPTRWLAPPLLRLGNRYLDAHDLTRWREAENPAGWRPRPAAGSAPGVMR